MVRFVLVCMVFLGGLYLFVVLLCFHIVIIDLQILRNGLKLTHILLHLVGGILLLLLYSVDTSFIRIIHLP